jgi:DNA-directed RNA polymerase
MSPSSDPIIASYDVYLTDSQISRYVLQYLDRPADYPYDERVGQKPTAFRLKPKTGLVEVDVPIDTQVHYDVNKGLRYGDALKRSRVANKGGGFGLAGGFNPSSAGARVKMESEDVEMIDSRFDEKDTKSQASLLKQQTLGGRIKTPQDGDPLYMLGAFRGSKSFASSFLDLLGT